MSLRKLSSVQDVEFRKPSKKIHDGSDVSYFLTSLAYRDIMTFVLQLNNAMVPRKLTIDGSQVTRQWNLDSYQVTLSEPVQRLRELISRLRSIIDEAPPDMGPRRFGNVSFRKWYALMEERIPKLLQEYLPNDVHKARDSELNHDAFVELEPYLLGSFGSAQRLDYGTGHELSFLAFLACIWRLGGFEEAESGVEERGIVIGIFEPYLELIRHLIKTYTLEPAGSHGVWGLDDNSFLPYVFGSAQLCPPILEGGDTPMQDSISGAPDPADITKKNRVEEERKRNIYFSAVGNIYDVKNGPFFEHSPVLYDVSGVRDGWGKINKGMLKMYNAEVLSKFPVVQHFPFGSLFRWEKDPNAAPLPTTTHTASQPLRDAGTTTAMSSTRAPTAGVGTAAPWAKTPAGPPKGMVDGVTRAPWASTTPAPPVSTRMPGTGIVRPSQAGIVTRSPWAKKIEERENAKQGNGMRREQNHIVADRGYHDQSDS